MCFARDHSVSLFWWIFSFRLSEAAGQNQIPWIKIWTNKPVFLKIFEGFVRCFRNFCTAWDLFFGSFFIERYFFKNIFFFYFKNQFLVHRGCHFYLKKLHIELNWILLYVHFDMNFCIWEPPSSVALFSQPIQKKMSKIETGLRRVKIFWTFVKIFWSLWLKYKYFTINHKENRRK